MLKTPPLGAGGLQLPQKYEIWVNPTFLPIKNCCENYIFQEYRHLFSSNTDVLAENMLFFYLIKTKPYQIHAQMCGILENDTFISRNKATFGSISAKKGIDFEILGEFWNEIELFLKEKNAKNIIIKHYPSIYEQENSILLSKIFEKANFSKQTELNYVLSLKNIDFFEENLHISAFRHLKKAQKQDFLFEKIGFEQSPHIYDYIHAHRTRKNYPMTMQKADFLKLWADFQEEIHVFGLKNNDILVAVCVFLAINKRILYYFYPADHSDYQAFSPMTLLIWKTYQWAEKQGFELMDLGIATENGEPNMSLMRYKQHLGGIVSEKNIYYKEL